MLLYVTVLVGRWIVNKLVLSVPSVLFLDGRAGGGAWGRAGRDVACKREVDCYAIHLVLTYRWSRSAKEDLLERHRYLLGSSLPNR